MSCGLIADLRDKVATADVFNHMNPVTPLEGCIVRG